jgi:hypothetical protein
VDLLRSNSLQRGKAYSVGTFDGIKHGQMIERLGCSQRSEHYDIAAYRSYVQTSFFIYPICRENRVNLICKTDG